MNTDPPVGLDLSAAMSDGHGGAVVEVWAVPGASRTEITGLHNDAVRIRVAAPPEGGKANRAIANLLQTVTGSEAEMIQGRHSRRKRFLLKGVSSAEVAHRFSEQVR